MHITQNIRNIQKELINTRLMAVTKKRTPSEILECYRAGVKLFGENRAQEIIEKWTKSPLDDIRKNTRLHFIGHLQTGKVRHICPLVDAIQSVDSLKLAKKIDQECQKIKKIMPVFLEINIAAEPQKHGFAPKEISQAYQIIKQLEHIKVIGLMCMARHQASKKELRSTFQTCKQLADSLGLKQLSMGMSHDYHTAVQQGATLVRIGSKIFDQKSATVAKS